MKKRTKIILFVVGVIFLLTLSVSAVMLLGGNTVTVARCIVTDHGDIYMVCGDRPVRLNYNGRVNCQTGDKLLIVHSVAFAESYPEQTSAVLIIKIGSGSEMDVPESAFEIGFREAFVHRYRRIS